MTAPEELKRRLELRESIKTQSRKLNLENSTNDKIIKLLEKQIEEEKENQPTEKK